MDGNKDAAQKCLRIGKESLEAGDRVRAFRFLTKAQRLDPSLHVDDLLSSVGEEGDGGRKDTAPSPNSAEKPIRGDGAASSSAKASFRGKEAYSSGDNWRCYTEEQVSIVLKIKSERDYYQILGLERSCTEEDVRKAYRKLSLKVHPDKNKAPGAEEAFKSVSKAFQCLSNEETRKRYDIVGSEEPLHQLNKHTTRHAAYGYNGFYEADIDAEEIFRNFFFGGMAPATTQFGQFRFRTGGMGGARAHNEHRLSNSNLRMLIQVLPVIVLILINFIPSSDPPFALSSSYAHEQRLVTSRGVPFYVKQGKFEQQYPRDSAERLQLEDRVEKEYVSIVSQNCRLELQRRQWGLTNETPHCDLFQKYKAAVDAEA